MKKNILAVIVLLMVLVLSWTRPIPMGLAQTLKTTTPTIIPTRPPADEVNPVQDGSVRTYTTYTVKSGDSLYKLARQFGTTVAAIQQANGLKTTSLRIGQVLKIPAQGIAATVIETYNLTPTASSAQAQPTPLPTDEIIRNATGNAYQYFASLPPGHGNGIRVESGFSTRLLATLPKSHTPMGMTWGPDGRLYVSATLNPFDYSSRIGSIFVLTPAGFVVYATGLLMPNGLAFKPGTMELYVAHRGSDSEGRVSVILPGGIVRPFLTGLPCCYTSREHQPSGVVWGADGWLYLSIGSRSDHGPDAAAGTAMEIHEWEAAVLRIAPDASSVEVYAKGLRNGYDLTFDAYGSLWTGENGPDFGPPERLHRIAQGGHYGFPYYDGCFVCPLVPAGLQISLPVAYLPPHATPTGITAYFGAQFPVEYHGDIFLALWNPHVTPGIARWHNGQLSLFLTGIATPVDVANAPDGTLTVADFMSGGIYQVRWGK
jgi:glucose/arabinose dehydrogenase